MMSFQLGLRLLGSALVAVTMTAGGAYGQSPSGKAVPPLSYPAWQYLHDNPEAMRGFMLRLPPVSTQPGPAPGSGRSFVPSEQAPAPQGDPASPWQQVPNPMGLNFSNPLLMTDGTVIVLNTQTSNWWRLTPAINGSYVNGVWSQIASLPAGYAPTFFASAVLADGRVIVEGGEYNLGNFEVTTLGAIYDPVVDPPFGKWTPVSKPSGWDSIGDAQSVVLPDGTFMLANKQTRQQALLNARTLTWTATGSGKFDINNEEGWTLLWDGNVLTVDAYVGTGACDTNSERYLTRFGSWVTAGSTVRQLPDCNGAPMPDCQDPMFRGMPSFEIGPQVLRPDGTVIAFGGTGSGVAHTAIFDSIRRRWRVGPDLPTLGDPPQNYTLADAPAALLPNGNVLFAASPGVFCTPTHFFEMEKGTNNIMQVADTTDAADRTSFVWNFLVLPTGQILVVETYENNVWIYTPSGSPKRDWAPAITSVSPFLRTGSTYRLHGLQLNGLSQGASYGDNVQAATNYPLVRIVNATTRHVFYARTFGHSTMGIGPEDEVTSTHFTVPVASEIEAGRSYLYVVANGIASEPVTVEISPHHRFRVAERQD
jgi:hypothetical protein